MEENKTKELNLDSLESTNGGIIDLSQDEQNVLKKRIRNAKRQGASLEDYLQKITAPSVRSFIETIWDKIG